MIKTVWIVLMTSILVSFGFSVEGMSQSEEKKKGGGCGCGKPK